MFSLKGMSTSAEVYMSCVWNSIALCGGKKIYSESILTVGMGVYIEGTRGGVVTRIYAGAAIALFASAALLGQEFRGTLSPPKPTLHGASRWVCGWFGETATMVALFQTIGEENK
jgi:hypothetical protein